MFNILQICSGNLLVYLLQISSGNLLVYLLQISSGYLLVCLLKISSSNLLVQYVCAESLGHSVNILTLRPVWRSKYRKCLVITVVTTLLAALAWIGQQMIKVSLYHMTFHCSYLDGARLSSAEWGTKFLPENVIWSWRPPIPPDLLT